MRYKICQLLLALFSWMMVTSQSIPATTRKTPIMGWSSWNHFKININEKIIRAQADYMVSTGLKAAGYSYINIDDGYFGGRDKDGNLLAHRGRFPEGMKSLADYIHSKGLKAGIYSDAGINTCGSVGDKDTAGVGVGLFGHEEQDLRRMLNEWGYDFLKVDWCGGESLGLDEQLRYSQIGEMIRSVKKGVVYNVCRWKFPGKWVVTTADSWRISGDISNDFQSILHIIDLNADYWMYAGPGHVNDMDMLQVGRGMSYEEDKTHFSMWCMLCSPLLAGNDLTKMSRETIGILTNPELIALDQDPLVYQARKITDDGDQEVWARPLVSTMSGKVAVALLNRATAPATIAFNVDSLGIGSNSGYTYRDLWAHKDYPSSLNHEISFTVPPHGVIVLVLKGVSTPYNIFQRGKKPS